MFFTYDAQVSSDLNAERGLESWQFLDVEVSVAVAYSAIFL